MSVKVTLEIGHEAILKHKPTPDGFTHDWELYVRGCDGKDISHFIEKVVFNLHESFPKPKRVIKEPPYILKESGYAGFLLPIDIYLKNRDEPKKATFNYDLMLQANTSYRRAQKEKIVIGNPTDEFRRKLLRGGGELINPTLSSMDDKHKDLNDEKSQLLSKPKLGGDNSNSGTSKKHKHRPDESKASSTFANLFGTPITKTTNKVSPDAKNSKHSPNQLPSKSSSSNKSQEKSTGKEKDKEKSEKSSSKHKHNSPYKDKELRKNNNNTASSESLVEKSRDGSVGKTNNSGNKKEKPHTKERERSREKNSSKKSSSPKRSGSNSSSSLQQSIIPPPPPSTISPTRNSTLTGASLLDSSNYTNTNSNNSSSISKNQTTQNSNSKGETGSGTGSAAKKSKRDKKEKNHDKDHRERDKRDKDKTKDLLHQHNTNSNPAPTTNNNKFSLDRFELKTNSNSSINSKDKEYSLKDSNSKIQPPSTLSQQTQDGYSNNHRINTGETLPISTPSSTSSDRKHKHHKKKDKNKKDVKVDSVTNSTAVHKEKSEVRKKERNQDKLNSGSSNKNFEYSKKSDDRTVPTVPPVSNTTTTTKSNNVNNSAAGANPLSALIREMSDKESEDESSDIDNHTNNNANNSSNMNHSPHSATMAPTMPGSIEKSDLVNENSNHIVNSNNSSSSNSNLTKSQKSKEKMTDSSTGSSGGKVKNSRKRNALSANLMEPPSSVNQTISVKSAKRSTNNAASSSIVPVTDESLIPPNNPSSSVTGSVQQSTSYLNSGTNNSNNNNNNNNNVNVFDSDNIPQLPLDYMNELKELQHKIMTLKDNNDLQQVVELIAATGRYEITSKTFDFDLCVLDRLTVQRLQEFFATLS